MSYLLGDRIKKVSRLVQSKRANIVSILQETISQIKFIQSHTQKNYEINRFKNENEQTFNAIMHRNKLMEIYYPLTEVIIEIGSVIILLLGGIK